MKFLFSLTVAAVLWHVMGLDKLAMGMPAVWHTLGAVLGGVK
jgi:hypothetical protein